MRIEPLVENTMILGESPLWDVNQQRIYWVDIIGQKIMRSTVNGQEFRQWDIPSAIGSLALRRDDTALIALKSGFHFYDFKNNECSDVMINVAGSDPETRLNDGKVDRQGRFVCGSMDLAEKSPKGILYRIDTDLSLHILQGEIIVFNGPCWSVSGGTFYFGDSGVGAIWRYDYDLLTGNISNRTMFAKVDTRFGALVDGMTVDSEGCVWSAQVFGGKIVRYTPYGKVDRTIEMPTRNVTSLMFGGPNLDILFVTSMATPPLSKQMNVSDITGTIYAVHGLGVNGVPETRFNG
jgi:L-arabinonolactonase